MDALVERIRSLREELAALEDGLTAGPRPESLAWIDLDASGGVQDASPAALTRLGVVLEAVRGTPIGVLADVAGDPLRDGFLTVSAPDGRAGAISVGGPDGRRTLVLGAVGVAPPSGGGGGASRKLVHDMSNVLGIMRGRAELVAMQSSDDNVRRSMEEIQKAADRALEILDADHGA